MVSGERQRTLEDVVLADPERICGAVDDEWLLEQPAAATVWDLPSPAQLALTPDNRTACGLEDRGTA
jgi:hypothetical protein